MKRCMPLLLALLAAALLINPALAQDAAEGDATNEADPKPTPQVDKRFASPRATLFTFLKAMNEVTGPTDDANWQIIEQCFQADPTQFEDDPEALRTHAHDLWRAMNHIEEFKPTDFPDAKDAAALDRFYVFPREDRVTDYMKAEQTDALDLPIVLEKQLDGSWKFAAETLGYAPQLYQKLSQFEAQVAYDEARDPTRPWLEHYMPEPAQQTVFDIAYWQWAGLLLLIIVGLGIDLSVRAILRGVIQRVIRRQNSDADSETMRSALRPLGLFVAGIFWVLMSRTLELPGVAHTVVYAAARLFTIIAAVWGAWRLVDLLAEVLENRAANTTTKVDDVLVPLVRRSLKIFIFVFGVIYAASSLNINIWPMLTGLGIASAGIAFAAKDTIENFFGSVAVILDRPFEVGDWVYIDGSEGTVEEVGFRSTRIRTFYNSQISVPNANLVRAVVDNYGRRKYRRWKTTLGVQYDTTPDKLIAFTEGIRELVRTHPYTRKDYFQVYLNGFGASSLDVLVYVFYEVPDWSTELRERERLALDIIRLADKLGVSFAFPTQTLHLYKEAHAEYQTRHETPGDRTERRAAVQGIRSAHELVRSQPWRDEKPGAVQFRAGPSTVDDDEPENFIEDRTSGS